MRPLIPLFALAANPARCRLERFRANVSATRNTLLPDAGGVNRDQGEPFRLGKAWRGFAHHQPDSPTDRYVRTYYDKLAKHAELTAPFIPLTELTESQAEPSGEIDAMLNEEAGTLLIGGRI